MGSKCEVGTIAADVTIEIPGGGEWTYGIEGPAAESCVAASSERTCVNAGATLASAGDGGAALVAGVAFELPDVHCAVQLDAVAGVHAGGGTHATAN